MQIYLIDGVPSYAKDVKMKVFHHNSFRSPELIGSVSRPLPEIDSGQLDLFNFVQLLDCNGKSVGDLKFVVSIIWQFQTTKQL